MPARALDRVTISFGLVSIPAKVYTTAEPSHEIGFHLLHAADGARLKQQYVCSKDGEVVPRDEMIKGYEVARGKYVPLTADELAALEAISTNTIALEEFVPAEQVDPIYVDRSYYLGPDKGGEHAYALLARAMTDTELVGIATYAARGKQYLVEVRPYEDGLVMHQLRYPDEIKAWDQVPVPKSGRMKEAELELARRLIRQVATDTFEPTRHKDQVKARIRAAIERKLEGEELVAPVEEPRAQIGDLMAALKASLGQGGDGKSKPAHKAKRAVTPRPHKPTRAAPRSTRNGHAGATKRSSRAARA